MQEAPIKDRGIFYMAIAGLFFFCMSICVKLLSHFHVSQVVFFRGIVAIILCLIQLRILRISPWGNKKWLLFLRGFFGTIALVLFFYTLQKMPLSTAFCVQYLSPIFVTLLSALFLGQSVRLIQLFFFALAFLGIVWIKGFSTNIPTLPLILGVISALASGCAYTVIGKIGEDDHPLVIIFYFPLVILPVITPFMLNYWTWPNLKEWMLLILVGVFVQGAQYFMTLAYQKSRASKVSIVVYLGVIYGLIADFLIFGEYPTAIAFVGMGLILLGIIGNTIVKLPSKDKLIAQPNNSGR